MKKSARSRKSRTNPSAVSKRGLGLALGLSLVLLFQLGQLVRFKIGSELVFNCLETIPYKLPFIDIAADKEGKIYLLYDSSVLVLNKGQEGPSYPLPPEIRPAALEIMGPDLYVVGTDVPDLIKISLANGATQRIRVAGAQRLAGLATDHDERLYAVDQTRCSVFILNSDGAVQAEFGAPGSGPGEMRGPTHCAWGGELYVLDPGNHRILRWSGKGKFQKAFDAPWEQPTLAHLAADGKGHLFINNHLTNGVWVMTESGKKLGLATKTKGVQIEMIGPGSVGDSPDHFVFIASHQILRIEHL